MVLWTCIDGQLLTDYRIRLYIAASAGQIVATMINADDRTGTDEEFLSQIRRLGTSQRADCGSALLISATEQVQQYLSGSRTSFELPIAYRGTPFQIATWKALGEIPFGETRTYGDIAEMVGIPAAVRAVGQANRRNHLPVLVPCHRVTAAGGKLGGFAGATEAGARLKRALLDHELTALMRLGKLRATA